MQLAPRCTAFLRIQDGSMECYHSIAPGICACATTLLQQLEETTFVIPSCFLKPLNETNIIHVAELLLTFIAAAGGDCVCYTLVLSQSIERD